MKQKKNKKILIATIAAVLLVAATTVILWNVLKVPVNDIVVIEAGAEINIDDFFYKDVEDATFVSDIDIIDTHEPDVYNVWLEAKGKIVESHLVVKDTIPPVAEATYIETRENELPDAKDCITNIVDESEVKIEYKETPDVSTEGEIPAIVTVTDASRNVTEIEVTITVLGDTEPPVIEGVKDLEVVEGKTISYKKDITVTDNEDPDPTLKIDNSEVDLDTPGEYKVVYIATDERGNETSVEAKVTVLEKTTKYYDDEVIEMAQVVLDEITDESMSDMEVAFAIYKWAVQNIYYSGYSDKSDWTVAAYNAFNLHSGDCYTFFAATKALYMAAGIDVIDVVKSDTTYSSHFWVMINLGDGWYHVDACPRGIPGDDFFMVTDLELEVFSSTHYNSHIFDRSLYPASATESVQHMVNYYNLTLTEE
ncbi:MAG: hypothetical protein E7263_03350 [Lachnospiraceae bacterium]|nr:hypothetical protein [Lachnospiraceae bacterium]